MLRLNQLYKLKPTRITSRLLPSLRAYHSIQHDNALPLNSNSIEYKILNRALEEYTPSLGFTDEAILKSTRELGYNDSIIALFNNGSKFLDFYLKKQRLELLNFIESEEFKTLRSETDKVKYLVKTRLLLNAPYVQHLNQLQGRLIFFENLEDSFSELHQLADDVLFYSGDASNQFDWYTKRFEVASKYVMLETFMSQDKSEGFAKTLELVDEKFAEGSAVEETMEFLKFNAISLVSLIKSQASRG
ncbi:hypothetical protein WICPIJ_006922 [Wickerhamomyces pijperi]|uniref:Ubiquinone biosynthesis protein n=1 Tax=Wickerhamomyces pijperi TaxID=599730 RepID=A0A9P8Q3C8_WICPI|nr:hypothetical protein WICPIJ_006922 [Wickerhamomyces pijperi]